MKQATDWFLVIMACAAIASVYYWIVTDVWFVESLIGRALAVLILTVVTFCVWMHGVCHGMEVRND